MTLISVIIPAYNRGKVIKRAIQSVLNQTYQVFEVIIVDDGSMDDTVKVVAAIAEEDQRVRYIRHETNKGAQAARNTGIRVAQGEWIAFLDSDDRWLPHSLKTRLTLAKKEGLKVVYSDCDVLCSNGNMKLYRLPPMAGYIYRDVLTTPGPMFQSLLVTKEALERIGYLDEQIVAYQEWDTAIRLAKYYPFGFVAETTFIYDCRGNDTISQNKLLDAEGYKQIVHKHISAILRFAGLRALSQHYLEIAFRYQMVGHSRVAQRYKIMALVCWPFRPRLLVRKFRSLLNDNLMTEWRKKS